MLRRATTIAATALVAVLVPAASASGQAANPGLEILRFEVPSQVEKLRTEGTRTRMRCRVECRVTTKLSLPRGQANELGLESRLIGKRSFFLPAGRARTIGIELVKPVRRTLKGFEGEIDVRIASHARSVA